MESQVKLDKTFIDPKYSVTENVYGVLKRNIIKANLVPGQRISEKEISELLDVSRTPVRESFLLLSNQGLLEILPQRGTFISKISLKEVSDGLFIRKSLELSVMDEAVNVLTDDDLNDIEDILTEQKKSINNRDLKKFVDLDDQFHKMIFFRSKKEKVWELICTANIQYDRVRVLTLFDTKKMEILHKEHSVIFNGLKNRNIGLLKKSILKHLGKLMSEEEILKVKFPNYFTI